MTHIGHVSYGLHCIWRWGASGLQAVWVSRMRRTTVFAIVLLVGSVAVPALAQTDRYDALANSPMFENRPTPETTKLLKDELLFQRATQTYLWALPLVNTLGMKFGSEKVFGAGYNIASGLEGASRRQDFGDDAQFGRHLRHELLRPRQGRPDGF
jgi:hypothetical protein